MDLVEARARGFDAAARHPWERARLALAMQILARHARLTPGAAVVDFGCGDTFVVGALARAYPEVMFYAVDSAFSDELLAMFQARVPEKNVRLFSSLDRVGLEQPAAAILLMDVLEHIEDDVAVLSDICRRPLVGPDTRVLITVPAYQPLFCSHDRFLGHYRRYSPAQLRATVSAAGLQPIVDGRLFATLVPLRILQVVRERTLGAPAEAATDLAEWRGGETFARMLSTVLSAEGRAALALAERGIVLPGLSNFALCRTSA